MSFSTYAHAIHRSLQHQYSDLPLKLGQVQQLLAAALGHNSLASYQTVQPEEQFGSQILIDRPRLLERLNRLDLPASLTDSFIAHFKSASVQVVYKYDSEYLKALMQYVTVAMPMLPDVRQFLAETGEQITSINENYVSFPERLEIRPPAALHVVSATVELMNPQSKVTRQMLFDGCISAVATGRRCLGAMELSGGLCDESDLYNQVTEYNYLSED
jgi:hypothetical protein